MTYLVNISEKIITEKKKGRKTLYFGKLPCSCLQQIIKVNDG